MEAGEKATNEPLADSPISSLIVHFSFENRAFSAQFSFINECCGLQQRVKFAHHC
jgi:hypothetical protein